MSQHAEQSERARRRALRAPALLGLGVDVAQGHHHGRPTPAADVVRWAVGRSRAVGAAR